MESYRDKESGEFQGGNEEDKDYIDEFDLDKAKEVTV